MKRLTIFGVLALAALLAAFGFSGRAAAQTPQQVNLTLSEFMINPMTFTAQAGQVVHFNVTNAGKFPHSVTFVYDGKFTTLFKAPIPGGQQRQRRLCLPRGRDVADVLPGGPARGGRHDGAGDGPDRGGRAGHAEHGRAGRQRVRGAGRAGAGPDRVGFFVRRRMQAGAR